MADQLLGQMPADALGEERVLGVELEAGLVAVLAGAVLGPRPCRRSRRPSPSRRRSTGSRPQRSPGRSRHPFPRPALPASDKKFAEAERIAALVVHERRHQAVRKLGLASVSARGSSDGCASPARSADCRGPSSRAAARPMRAGRRRRRTGCARRSREPFSSTHTASSIPAFCAACLARIAAASPAGPPPTMTRS